MTKDEQILADLKALLAFFRDPTNWTQGSFEANKPNSSTEKCHCLAGGMMSVTGVKGRFNTLHLHEPRIIWMKRALGFNYSQELIRWNDSALTAHSSVLKRIRAAIKTLTPKPAPKRKYTRKAK